MLEDVMFCHTKTSVAHFDSHRKVPSSLCELVNEMRGEARYCDLELVVSGCSMPVHKIILAGASPFFDRMLSSGFLERNSKSVDLSDTFSNPEILEDILDYLYTGRIILSEDNFRHILKGASYFLIEKLRDVCSHFMFVNLSPVNALTHWEIANMYNLEMVSEICCQMIRARFHDLLIYRNESLNITERVLVDLVNEGGMTFLHTVDRIRYLMKWVSIMPDQRMQVVHALLQNPISAEKLGLSKALLECAITQDSSFDVMQFLQMLVDNPLLSVPQLDETNEALVGWQYKLLRAEDTRVLTVCAYIPKLNRWFTLTKLKVMRNFGRLIGFRQRQMLFKSQHGFVIVNLDDLTFERVPLPNLQRTSGIRSHCIFICKGEVFCIMEISKYIKRFMDNGSAFMYLEARVLMKVYSFETQTWMKVCDVSLPNRIAWLPLQFHVVPRDDLSGCYILAMSTVNNYPIQGPRNQWRINGPYLLAVKKRRTKFMLYRLTDPPLNSDDVVLHDVYGTLRFVGKGNKLYMYGSVYDPNNRDIEQCKGILQYNLDTDTWSSEPYSLTSTFPTNDLNQVKGLPKVRIQVGNMVAGGVQSFTEGNLYHFNVPCPFISQFWAADIDTGEVRELTPPPTEKLQDFTACNVPRTVLLGASGHYSHHFEKKYKNPLLHAYLTGYNKFWSCTFGKPGSPRSSDTS